MDIKQLSDVPLTIHDYALGVEQTRGIKENEILLFMVVAGFNIVLDQRH